MDNHSSFCAEVQQCKYGSTDRAHNQKAYSTISAASTGLKPDQGESGMLAETEATHSKLLNQLAQEYEIKYMAAIGEVFCIK